MRGGSEPTPGSQGSVAQSAAEAARLAALTATKSGEAAFATTAAGADAAKQIGTGAMDFVGTGTESALKIGSHGARAAEAIAGSAGKHGAKTAEHVLAGVPLLTESGVKLGTDAAHTAQTATSGAMKLGRYQGARVMRDADAADHRRALAAVAATKGREAPGYAKALREQKLAQEQADIGKKAFKSREALRAQESQYRIMGQKSSMKQAAEEARANVASEVETNRRQYVDACKKKLKELSGEERKTFEKTWDIKSDMALNKYCGEYGKCRSSGRRYGAWEGAHYNLGRWRCKSLLNDFNDLPSKLETSTTPAAFPPVSATAGDKALGQFKEGQLTNKGGRRSRRRRRKSKRRKATKKRSGRKSGRKSGRSRRRRRRTVKKA